MTASAARAERFDTASQRMMAFAWISTLTAALLPALALSLDVGLNLGTLLLRYP